MNISSISSAVPNFKACVISKGNWTPHLAINFAVNSEVNKLSSGNYDVIAEMHHKKAGAKDINHSEGENLYKLSIRSIPTQPTWFDKLKERLGLLPKVNVTRHFHREDSLISIMDLKINAEKYAKKLRIK